MVKLRPWVGARPSAHPADPRLAEGGGGRGDSLPPSKEVGKHVILPPQKNVHVRK